MSEAEGSKRPGVVGQVHRPQPPAASTLSNNQAILAWSIQQQIC